MITVKRVIEAMRRFGSPQEVRPRPAREVALEARRAEARRRRGR